MLAKHWIPILLAMGVGSAFALPTDIDGTQYSFDQNTQLYWLDVGTTVGLSVDQVQARELPGWRHATSAEVRGLLDEVHLYSPLPVVQALGGYTGRFDGLMAYRMLEGVFAGETGYEVGRIKVFDDRPLTYLEIDTGRVSASTPLAYSEWPYTGGVGHYLVSSLAPVPEPQTWTMFGLGILALGCRARRQQANAA